MGRKTRTRSFRLVISIFVLICALASFFSGAVSADKSSANIEGTRSALEKWVETESVISREKRDFELAKEMLNERIELVKREIKSLQDKISEAEKSIAEADKKRIKLVEENEKLKEATSSLNKIAGTLENRTKDLLRRLPNPIRETVQPLSQRLPADPNGTKLSLTERFQNIVGIINEINKFNSEITATSEVHTLKDGSSIEVTALYVGIGQGYYVNSHENIAGIGRPSVGGWIWEPADEAAGQISDAIAILKNEKPAFFVQLPVEIK